LGPTNSDTVEFTVTFNQDVINLDTVNDLIITHNGTSSTGASFAGGPSIYTITVSGITGDGTFTLAVDTASNVQDLAAESVIWSVTSDPVAIDNTPPDVVSITRTGGEFVTENTTIDFLVTFSSPVAGLDIADFVIDYVDGQIVTGAAITNVSGSGNSYTVSLFTGTGTGALSIDLVDDDSIADPAGNSLGGAGAGNGSFTGGENVTVIKSTPLSPWSLAMALALAGLVAVSRISRRKNILG